ncbi:MAG TPA: DegT/DnrJ/EryC1/StrS family aminotransferase [Pyrinomonadaceae bacterium]
MSKPPATMRVPLLDLRAQYETLREEVLASVGRVLESQGFVLGADVGALEAEVASYAGARHAVGCASGSDALLLALMALDVRAGDEVVTTPYSFFATAGSIARLGARPVFVDIEPRSYNIDPEKIGAALTERTRALMPVHLYGQCAEMDAINALASRHGVAVVEDAAQAIGARDRGRGAGAMSGIGCLSFYPTKNLGGAGDGGMLLTNDDALAARLRSLRVHGESSKYHHREIGFNSRLDTLQAAVLRVKLPRLDSWSDARALNAARYRELFADAGLLEEVGLPFEREGARHIYNQFVVRVRGGGRDALVEHLRREGVGTEVYYPVPLHLQECFRYLGYREGDFPEAERAARETLALPVYPELTEGQQRYVVDAVQSFFR